MRIIEGISTIFGGSSHGLSRREASGFFPQWLQGDGFGSARKKQYNPSGWRRIINWFKDLKRKYSLYKTIKKWAPSVLGAGAIATLAAHFRKPATEALGKLFDRPPEEIAPTFEILEKHVANSSSGKEKLGANKFFATLANKVVITLTCLGAGLVTLYALRNKISEIVMTQSRKVSRNFTDVVSERFSELLEDPNSAISRAIAGVGQKYGPEMADWAGHVFQFQLTKPSTVAKIKEAVGNALPTKKEIALHSIGWYNNSPEASLDIGTLDVIHHFHATLERPTTVDKDALEEKSLEFLSHHASLVTKGAPPVTKETLKAKYKISNENFTKKLATEVVLNAKSEHATELKAWLLDRQTSWFKKEILTELGKVQPQKGWNEDTKKAFNTAKTEFLTASKDRQQDLLGELSRLLPHTDPGKTVIAELKIKINKSPYEPLIKTCEKVEGLKAAEIPPQEPAKPSAVTKITSAEEAHPPGEFPSEETPDTSPSEVVVSEEETSKQGSTTESPHQEGSETPKGKDDEPSTEPPPQGGEGLFGRFWRAAGYSSQN